MAGIIKLPRSSRLLNVTPDKSIGSGGGTVAAGCAGAAVLVGATTVGCPLTADSRGAEASGVAFVGELLAGGGTLEDTGAGGGGGGGCVGTALDDVTWLDEGAGLLTSAAGGGGGGGGGAGGVEDVTGCAVGAGMLGLKMEMMVTPTPLPSLFVVASTTLGALCGGTTWLAGGAAESPSAGTVTVTVTVEWP